MTNVGMLTLFGPLARSSEWREIKTAIARRPWKCFCISSIDQKAFEGEMSDNEQGAVHGDSGGGIAGRFPDAGPLQIVAAPSTSAELNAVRLRLIPVACWRVDDVRFAFDSSLVTPDVAAELQMLVSLREAHKKTDTLTSKTEYPPLSVFGHADPVGTDDYNKALSGRRATAIYALLIANSEAATSVSLWQQIAEAENWGADQRQTMRNATGLPDGTSDSDLFKAYLQKLCPKELQLTRKDFLSQGADSGGKGDYQGCSEFNPVLIFSQNREAQFEDSNNEAARNLANAQNRRVVVLLFRVGSKVDPNKWPCPRSKEGTAGCIRRFWSDGEKRGSTRLQSQDREYVKTRDTFACRFYDRICNSSPCENHSNFRIRLYDSDGNYIPNAPCRVTIEQREPYQMQADVRGVIVLRDVKVPSNCVIEWGFTPKDGEDADLEFVSNFQWTGQGTQKQEEAAADAGEQDDSAKMLNNLGYASSDAKLNLKNFQRDYGDLASPALQPTGEMDASTKKLLTDVYQACADDLRQTQINQT